MPVLSHEFYSSVYNWLYRSSYRYALHNNISVNDGPHTGWAKSRYTAIILYYTILYYTILYYTKLYYTIIYYTILY